MDICASPDGEKKKRKMRTRKMILSEHQKTQLEKEITRSYNIEQEIKPRLNKGILQIEKAWETLRESDKDWFKSSYKEFAEKLITTEIPKFEKMEKELTEIIKKEEEFLNPSPIWEDSEYPQPPILSKAHRNKRIQPGEFEEKIAKMDKELNVLKGELGKIEDEAYYVFWIEDEEEEDDEAHVEVMEEEDDVEDLEEDPQEPKEASQRCPDEDQEKGMKKKV